MSGGGHSLDGRFGWAYRRAVLSENPHGAVVRLVMVLVDLAYTQRTPAVTTSWRVLGEETFLYRSALALARDWLVDRRLLAYSVNGTGRQARSTWELLLPETFAPAGTKERSGKRSGKRSGLAGTPFPGPSPDTPLAPLKGGDENEHHRRTRTRRRRQSTAEVIEQAADRVFVEGDE